jgi:hypothetical protein
MQTWIQLHAGIGYNWVMLSDERNYSVLRRALRGGVILPIMVSLIIRPSRMWRSCCESACRQVGPPVMVNVLIIGVT